MQTLKGGKGEVRRCSDQQHIQMVESRDCQETEGRGQGKETQREGDKQGRLVRREKRKS